MNGTIREDEKKLFLGKFVRRLDAKRRIVIPAEWRAVIGEPSAVVVNMPPGEPCLRAHSAHAFRERIKDSMSMSVEPNWRALQIIASCSTLLSWDSSGRIRLPDAMLQQAGITDTACLVGMITSFEIWNGEAYAQAVAATPGDKMRTALHKIGF
jgi:MraZ protein